MTPEALEKAQALARKYNQEIFPPDYLPKYISRLFCSSVLLGTLSS
jgi:hypothetical protein